jgi:HSF-type DNA-binding
MMPPDGSVASDKPLDRLLKAAASEQGRRLGGGEGGGLASESGVKGYDDSAAVAGRDITADPPSFEASALDRNGAATAATPAVQSSSASCEGSEGEREDDVVNNEAGGRTGSVCSDGVNGAAPTNRRALIHAPYHDYSRSPPTPGENEQLGSLHNPAAPSALARSQHAKEPTFPLKLHMILARAEWQDIICWLPHGRSFRILNPNAFEDVVLPLYFQHGRYASFARQLNGWNFRRISRGTDFNSYYHEVRLQPGATLTISLWI